VGLVTSSLSREALKLSDAHHDNSDMPWIEIEITNFANNGTKASVFVTYLFVKLVDLLAVFTVFQHKA